MDIKIEKWDVTIPEGTISNKLERDLQTITNLMNARPLKVNPVTYLRNLKQMQVEYEEKRKLCLEKTGNPTFRPNAKKDCEKEFIEKRGLDARISPKGKPSIDKEMLGIWANDGDDLAPLVIAAREARSKLSQLEKWQEYADKKRVMPHWIQLGTPHGRYATEEPNLQNRIREIRETVEPPWDDASFISMDLGQAEYVTWASLSNDEVLMNSFMTGKDFHAEMGALIAAEVDQIKKDDTRQIGKTVNFALLYRMMVQTLAQRLGVDRDVAQLLVTAYRMRAPKAVDYIDQYLEKVWETGVSETHFGRQRAFDLNVETKHDENELEKTAWHHHCAGTAAEILKIKQLRVVKALEAKGYMPDRVYCAIQMHDEIILVCRDSIVEEVKVVALEAFNQKIDGFLDFAVDCRVGKNWLEVSK